LHIAHRRLNSQLFTLRRLFRNQQVAGSIPAGGSRNFLKTQQRLARDLVGQIANDLATELEWIAVAHHNTEHPHVHMVLRGVKSDGQPLRLRRDYVKYGIRGIAQDICTRQLGYRPSLDAAEAERREIGEPRFTSLDRAIRSF